ncbi:MAG: HEAT repeat domain-containing protein [Planctomycetes bacterium]|nr:HEAT repeat domain-containing protein [Planctomycetota bacterium]MCH9725545.1 HEAT repeat domain-containing protein [Planctomycetota bacterium]MCH9777599.1 HEAT repeat domain-containing protein [Planctomycetota bacterium]MCH9789953.1 HEAT repeat domain-containing protein [Planctomycetota bacterium]
MKQQLPRITVSGYSFLIFLLCFTFTDLLQAENLPRVPKGFSIERVTNSELTKYPMMAGFDDRGRLFIAESSGENTRAPQLIKEPKSMIRMLEDRDGDGRFDKSTVFADKLTLPMGALWHDGSLYVASPPNIWRLTDHDDDGVADERKIIIDSFGFSGNAASIHGCFRGPEGRLYWCDGRHGHEFKDKTGKVTSKGLAARIFSCKPDGSDIEVHCGGGMDNPVEIDFTPEGEMIGSVNILMTRPRVDCLVHWMEGGVYPHFGDCVSEFKRTGDLLGPITRFGHVAVSGMLRYRSTQFGQEYQGNIFTSIFNTHKVIRSQLVRSGATFETKEEDFLVSDDPDFHPTDIIEDADGSLLVINTGGWFRIGCPQSQISKPEIHGAIYRIRKTGTPALQDPYGLTLDWKSLSPHRLLQLLNDSRPFVQQKSIDQLAKSGDSVVPLLARVVSSPAGSFYNDTSKRNAIWTLTRIGNAKARSAIQGGLNSSETVQMTATKSLGTLRDAHSISQLSQMVKQGKPAVQRTAATALGRICEAGRGESVSEKELKPVMESLFHAMKSGSPDRTLEHALIYAMIRIDHRDLVLVGLSDSSPAVRRAALIALDQMDSGNLTRELVTPLLDTDDPELQKEALTIIGEHEGWAGETLTLLKTWLSEDNLSQERAAVLRGFLVAQSADQDVQSLIAQSLTSSKTSVPAKSILLEVIQRSALKEFPVAWRSALEQTLKSTNSELQILVVRIAQTHDLPDLGELLKSLALDMKQPAPLRIESLSAIGSKLDQVDQGTFDFVMSRMNEDYPPLDRLAAARALAGLPHSNSQLTQLSQQLDAPGPLALPVLLRAYSKGTDEAVGLALIKGLNSSSAATNLSADELASLLKKYPESVQKAASPLLKKLGVDLAQQKAHLESLKPLLTEGRLEEGKKIFFGKKAACSGCHAVEDLGGKVGPDLTKIGAIRTGTDLLEAIALPSASFARGYRSYLVVNDAGRIYTGVISRESSDTVYLRTADLSEVRIARDEIEVMKESPTSIMPKGLEQRLSRQEIRDLLAYLQNRK